MNVNIEELTTVLIRHFNLHEGRYQIALGFRIGVGAVGGDPGMPNPVPGAMIGVETIGLTKVPNELNAPNIVDAAIVNPSKKRRAKAA